jgi:hypothetical protein
VAIETYDVPKSKSADRRVIPVIPVCADHDEECPDVHDKLHCWLYDPAQGFCPFLRS